MPRFDRFTHLLLSLEGNTVKRLTNRPADGLPPSPWIKERPRRDFLHTFVSRIGGTQKQPRIERLFPIIGAAERQQTLPVSGKPPQGCDRFLPRGTRS